VVYILPVVQLEEQYIENHNMQLIKNVEGKFYDNVIGEVKLFTLPIVAQIQQEDYINLNGYIAYLQDLSKVQDTFLLSKPANFGLKNRLNIEIITLNINY